ncbi:unnamed protein product [Acanthoscelides obtectus]|uniref:Uncharacterized protein n=1 Tax=Acanthoscelides obtectus TaxID=200917 RepID=A0A9P0K2M1_ACAOB|nr:unnamed protein product [Acanthoscelides obtectus]CAK1647994.1 hypothetical protein AOBTE_LOCUS15491 [Acanthoscelides obtectus]
MENLEKPVEKVEAKEATERKEMQIPSISTEDADSMDMRSDSPDPEYEDTADLASSIAKLRSLLQQRSSESSMSTPALSPIFLEAKYYGTKRGKLGCKPKLPCLGFHRPPEIEEQTAVAAAGPSRPPFAECVGGGDVDGPETTDGVMPSFYKFCAKTATGVLDKTLHTIKTALPGNAPGIEQNDNAWIFVQAELDEGDVFTRMKKLLTERKEFCTLDNEIDTAYEAIDSLDTFQLPYSPSVAFEDELDPFEVKLPVTRALVDIICELLADTSSPFVQEPIVKGFLLMLGPTMEHFLVRQVDKMVEKLCVELIRIPDKTNQTTLDLEMTTYMDALLESLPESVKMTFGRHPLSQAVSVFVSSMQNESINRDVALQLLELLALKLIEECSQLSPPAFA